MTDKVEDQEVNDQVEKTPEDTVITPEPNETEKQALAFGWKSKEQWVEDGNSEEDWVPAKHFLKFGDIKQKLIATERQVSKQDRIIRKMATHHTNVRQEAFQEAYNKLKSERLAALEEQDFVTAEKLKDRMEEQQRAFQTAGTLPPEIEQELKEVNTVQSGQPPQEFFAFMEQNPWYIADETKQDDMSKEADTIGIALMAKAQKEGKALDLQDFYKQVGDKIRKLYPEKFAAPKSPQVSSSNNGANKGPKSGPKLSDEELQVAKNLGLTPEQYAKELSTYNGRTR